ncbi:MAG: hypothetical protein WC916_01465 [Candidatus Woesearchaeota archaeon]
MNQIDTNIAYLVKGKPYQITDLILDGLFAMGSSFDSNSLYNRRRLVVPGRFIIGDFEGSSTSSELVLKDDIFFVDRTSKSLRMYEEHIKTGKLKPEQQWCVTDEGLHAIIAQLERYMFSLRKGQPIQNPSKFYIDWTPAFG